MTSELKPCPFCGGKADPEGWMSIDCKGPSCDDCGASANSADAWNTRAVPDVRELVTVGYAYVNDDGGLEYAHSTRSEARKKPLVLYSQAAAIIAAKEAAFDDEYNALVDRHNQAVAQIDSWCNTCAELEYRAEAAEAELAQFKSQEPVAWWVKDGFGELGTSLIDKIHLGSSRPAIWIRAIPLYSAPVSDSLKAENERLREALLVASKYRMTADDMALVDDALKGDSNDKV